MNIGLKKQKCGHMTCSLFDSTATGPLPMDYQHFSQCFTGWSGKLPEGADDSRVFLKFIEIN